MSRRLAAGVVALVLAAACAREPAHEYPTEVIENFVAACRTRAPEPACRCAIDRLRDTFTWEEYRERDRRMVAGEMPAEVAEAVRECGPG